MRSHRCRRRKRTSDEYTTANIDVLAGARLRNRALRRAWVHRPSCLGASRQHRERTSTTPMNVHNEILARNWAVQEILARNSGILQLMMQQRTFCVIVLHMTLRFSKNFSYVKGPLLHHTRHTTFSLRNPPEQSVENSSPPIGLPITQADRPCRADTTRPLFRSSSALAPRKVRFSAKKQQKSSIRARPGGRTPHKTRYS